MDSNINEKNLKKYNEINDLKNVLSTESGKRVLNRVFRDAFIFVHTYHVEKDECQQRSRIAFALTPIFNDCLQADRKATIELTLMKKEKEYVKK